MSIQVKNLTHIYEKGMPNESIALENISFEVEDGSFLGVIGHTGSGKSTLLQHLNGLLKPTEGTIVIGGVDITSPDVSMVDIRKRIGLVFQYPEYQLFEETVAKDVAFGPKNLGLSQEEIDERVKEAIELVGLDYEAIKDRSPFELSGGQKRRVAIAGVMAMEPDVLILDEPLSGVDVEGEHQLLDMLDELRTQYDLSIFLSTHDFATLSSFADKVILLNKKVMKKGTPDEMFASPEFYETFHLRMGKGGEV